MVPRVRSLIPLDAPQDSLTSSRGFLWAVATSPCGCSLGGREDRPGGHGGHQGATCGQIRNRYSHARGELRPCALGFPPLGAVPWQSAGLPADYPAAVQWEAAGRARLCPVIIRYASQYNGRFKLVKPLCVFVGSICLNPAYIPRDYLGYPSSI